MVLFYSEVYRLFCVYIWVLLIVIKYIFKIYMYVVYCGYLKWYLSYFILYSGMVDFVYVQLYFLCYYYYVLVSVYLELIIL